MYLSVSKKYAEFNTELARNEKNDCVVRSIATAAEISYNIAHEFCKNYLGRPDKKGTPNVNIVAHMLKAEEKGLELGGKKFNVSVLPKQRIKNLYTVKGEQIWRKKTISSFIKDNPKGTYMVMVAKHALTIKDGEVFDWDGMKFKPTRKVESAYELTSKQKNIQLSLF